MAGLAVADAIKTRFPQAEIFFVSTGNTLEQRCLGEKGYRLFKTGARAWKGSVSGIALFLISFLVSFFRCLWYWRELRPDVVFGLGGYASLVPVICAYFRRVPVILLEQNVIPGKATRFLAPQADLVLLSALGGKASSRWFSCKDKVRFTGVPLRESVLNGFKNKGKALEMHKDAPCKHSDGPTLLVLGGSQGARAINNLMVESLPVMKERLPRLQVIHSTGKEGYAAVKEAYKKLGLEDGVFDFLGDMAAAYSSADLVLSRAGATTLAEITAWGLPAVLIPYPYSTDRHQYYNAEELACRGAAVVVEEQNLTAHRLAELLLEILVDEEKLQRMRLASKAIGKPCAALEAINCMLELIEGGKRGRICQSLSLQEL